MSASALFLAACAFGAAGVAPLAPDAAELPVTSVTTDLALPSLSDQINALQQQESTEKYVHEERIRAGDTLAALMTRLGVEDEAAENFIKQDKVAKGVMQLKAGKRVQAQTDENGNLIWLRATVVDGKDIPVKNISVTRKGDKFEASEVAAKLERRVEMHSRTIETTLFAATDNSNDGAKLPDSVVKQIVEMFSTNIDFRSDLKRGDNFNVVYESFYQDGEFVRAGRILAGEFTNRGVTYQSVWFEDPVSGQGGYYSFDGKALKKAFLKSPLEFSRISSGFSMRVHPISGNWKQHKGIDFAAATGTPIRAAGDGVVDFAGMDKGGYGNLVVLKHWANYSTAYAHMSGFASGLKKGQKVSQGDVIGYVGSTGWSTGAHLHYEFRVGGEAADPTKLAMIQQAPLTTAEMARFKSVSGEMMHRFALLRPNGRTATLALAAK